MLNDLFIIKRIREGDIKAFEHLFRCYYSSLKLYAIGIIRRHDIAEEIIQELFYVLWKDRETIQVFTSLQSYLYSAVRNRCIQYLEHCEVRNRYKDKILSEGMEFFSSDPQDQLEYKEFEELIDKALRKMPERRLKIFQMHRLEGMKYHDIAQKFSISVKTVEGEITKALKTLRKVVENYT